MSPNPDQIPNASEDHPVITALMEVDLLALPEAVPELRHAVRQRLGEPYPDIELCVTELVGNVRGSPTAVPGGTIQLPGDPERQQRQRRQAEGIPLDDGTWGQLTELAGRLGVTAP